MLRGLGFGETIWPLVVIGVVLILAGMMVPGTQSGVASALVTFGCLTLVAGIAAPRFKKVRLPGGTEFESENGPDPAPWLEAEKKTLLRVARLVLNDDVKRAKRTVRKTLAQVRRYRAQTHAGNRDATAFRTLVELLRRAEEGSWFDGSKRVTKPSNAIEALQLVDFDPRIAYVLSQQMRPKDVAVILGRSQSEVEVEIGLCRSTIAPYIRKEKGSGG